MTEHGAILHDDMAGQVTDKKETSKLAARARRVEESQVFALLEREVPYDCKLMDRNSVIRLAITACNSASIRKNFLERMDRSNGDENLAIWVDHHLFDGFMLVLDEFGMVCHVTDQLREAIDIPQSVLLSSNVHPLLVAELIDFIQLRTLNVDEEILVTVSTNRPSKRKVSTSHEQTELFACTKMNQGYLRTDGPKHFNAYHFAPAPGTIDISYCSYTFDPVDTNVDSDCDLLKVLGYPESRISLFQIIHPSDLEKFCGILMDASDFSGRCFSITLLDFIGAYRRTVFSGCPIPGCNSTKLILKIQSAIIGARLTFAKSVTNGPTVSDGSRCCKNKSESGIPRRSSLVEILERSPYISDYSFDFDLRNVDVEFMDVDLDELLGSDAVVANASETPHASAIPKFPPNYSAFSLEREVSRSSQKDAPGNVAGDPRQNYRLFISDQNDDYPRVCVPCDFTYQPKPNMDGMIGRRQLLPHSRCFMRERFPEITSQIEARPSESPVYPKNVLSTGRFDPGMDALFIQTGYNRQSSDEDEPPPELRSVDDGLLVEGTSQKRFAPASFNDTSWAHANKAQCLGRGGSSNQVPVIVTKMEHQSQEHIHGPPRH